MSGKIIPPPLSEHRCQGIPPADTYLPGTRWECDDCAKQWIVVSGAQYNEPYFAWRIASAPPIQGEYRGGVR